MATLVKIQCPHCGATLKLKSRKPLGKKVACPKCEKPFLAKAAQKPIEDYEDDFGAGDDGFADYGSDDYRADDYGGGYDEFDERPRRPGGGKKKSKKKARKGMPRGLKIGLIAGGAVLGLVAVGLTIWMVVGMFSKKLDLTWLPEDANSISVVRYAEIWKSDLVQDDVDGDLRDAIKKMEDDYGLEPKDIVSVTTGSGEGERIKVVRTGIDMDPEKIVKNAGDYTEEEYDGKEYYKFGNYALYFPDKRTAVSGTEDSVKKAIDRGPKAEARDDLKFVDGSYQMIDINIKTKEQLEREEELRRQIVERGGSLSGFGRIPTGKIVATANCRSVTSSIKTKTQMKFGSTEDAKEYYETVKEMEKEFKEKFGDLDKEDFYDKLSEKQKREAKDFANSVSFSFSRSGDTINTTVTFTPPESLRKRSGFGFFFGGNGISKIKSLARNPGTIFSIPYRVQPRPRVGSPFGNRPGNSTEVRVYEATFQEFKPRFSGDNDPRAAAIKALASRSEIDPNRISVSGNKITFYSRPGKRVQSTFVLSGTLQGAGFRRARVRTIRTE